MERLRNILIVLVIVDVLGLVGFWFIYSTMNAKKEKEVELRQAILDETAKATQLITLRKTLGPIEKESGELEKYFYDSAEENQIKFIAQIESLGKGASGTLVEVKSLDLSPGEEPSLRGEVVLKGTWRELHHFLRLVETFPGRLIIHRFGATSLGGGDVGSVMWNGSISIELRGLKKT